MKNLFRYLCLASLVVLMAGCHSSRNVTNSGLSKEEMTAARSRYEATVARQFSYEFLQSKVKYSMDGGKSLSGKLNIEHGKRLCMTVTVLGIEVARVEANTESVMVVDKVDKVYAKASIAEAAAKLGLTEEARLETLEALLLGRIYVPGKGEAAKGDFSRFAWYPQENGELQADLVSERYTLSYVMSALNLLVATQVQIPGRQSNFLWEYAEPVTVGPGTMPSSQRLSVTGSNPISADLNFSAIAVNKKGWNSFKPGDNYREVTFAELIAIIKKMKN